MYSKANLTVTYLHGKVEKIDENNSKVYLPKVNDLVDDKHFIGTGKGSRFEIEAENSFFRIGSLSFVKFISFDEIFIHSGSFLFCSNRSQKSLKISSRISNATFQGSGTFIVDCFENGGFKFIPLECDGYLKTDLHPDKKLTGGRMIMVVGSPSYLGSAYDIDIMLLLKSSKLINYFPKPLPTFDKIGLAIYIQQLKLKGKYDALIGDAKTEKSLQIWGFGKKPIPE